MPIYEYRSKTDRKVGQHESDAKEAPEFEGWTHVGTYPTWDDVPQKSPIQNPKPVGNPSEKERQERIVEKAKQSVLAQIRALSKEAAATGCNPTHVHIDKTTECDFIKLTLTDTDDEKFLVAIDKKGVQAAVNENWKGKVCGLTVVWNSDKLRVE